MTIKLKVMSAVDMSCTNHSILCGWLSQAGRGIVVLNEHESLNHVIEILRHTDL